MKDETNFDNLGVIDDPRTDIEKGKDWKHDELAGAPVLNWVEKPKSEWKKYTKRDQSSSSSCVAQSSAKALEIIDEKEIVYSAHPIYRPRVNFPEPGMYLANAGQITFKTGTTTEALDPSQFLGETNMNRDITVPTPHKIFGYVPDIDTRNIDAVAEAIETQGHCILLFHAPRNEYLREIPELGHGGSQIGHCICGVDYFIYNGKKVILIEDSAGLTTTIDDSGRRLITEEYLEARFSGGMYFVPKTEASTQKPKHTFNKPLKYGMRSDADVTALQDILKYEGIFPLTIPSTGNYLDITAKAILTWQRKHAVAPEAELIALKGRTVGPKTRALLNSLYSK